MRYRVCSVNGVVWTGGLVDFNPTVDDPEGNKYLATTKAILEYVLARNEAGTYYPFWATCLGFERLTQLLAHDVNSTIIDTVDAENLDINLNLTPSGWLSRMLGGMSYELFKEVSRAPPLGALILWLPVVLEHGWATFLRLLLACVHFSPCSPVSLCPAIGGLHTRSPREKAFDEFSTVMTTKVSGFKSFGSSFQQDFFMSPMHFERGLISRSFLACQNSMSLLSSFFRSQLCHFGSSPTYFKSIKGFGKKETR